MNPTCPTCGQFMPPPRLTCDCGHPIPSHSLPDNPPKGCAAQVRIEGRLTRCPCRRHQTEVAGPTA